MADFEEDSVFTEGVRAFDVTDPARFDVLNNTIKPLVDRTRYLYDSVEELNSLRDRSTHTGMQPMSTIAGLSAALGNFVTQDDPRLLPDPEFYDVCLFFPATAITLGNSDTTLYQFFPRLDLSQMLLESSFIQMSTPKAGNLTLLIRNGDATWEVTATIPSGSTTGTFTGTIGPVSAVDSVVVLVGSLPGGAAPTDLTMTLRFEVAPALMPEARMLRVPQPDAVETILTFGVGASGAPTARLDRIRDLYSLDSQDKTGNVHDYRDVSASDIGESILAVRSDNTIVSISQRTGATEAVFATTYPRTGVAMRKDQTTFFTLENRTGWHLVEYTYPNYDQVRAIPLSPLGVASPNSLRVSGNSRYLLIGHSDGLTVINSFTGTTVALVSPPATNVLDAQVSPTTYAILSRLEDDVICHLVNNGEPMEYIGNVLWESTSCCAFNWDSDTTGLYPHFVVGGLTEDGYRVIPYRAGSLDFSEMAWEIVLDAMPKAVVFSEQDRFTGSLKESAYGRVMGVLVGNRMKIYGMADGALVDEIAFPEFTNCTAALWRFVGSEDL